MCLCSRSHTLHLPPSNSLCRGGGNLNQAEVPQEIYSWKTGHTKPWPKSGCQGEGWFFWLPWELVAIWEGSIMHRRPVPSWWEAPACQRSRFEGSLPAEIGPLPQSYKPSLNTWGPSCWVPAAAALWALVVRTPRLGHLFPSGRTEGRKIEQSQCREPLAHSGMLLYPSMGISIRESL